MNQENRNLRGPEYYANNDECHEKANEGYIYILTNPSFPNYVKLGYADDVEKRVKELNSCCKIHLYLELVNNF